MTVAELFAAVAKLPVGSYLMIEYEQHGDVRIPTAVIYERHPDDLNSSGVSDLDRAVVGINARDDSDAARLLVEMLSARTTDRSS